MNGKSRNGVRHSLNRQPINQSMASTTTRALAHCAAGELELARFALMRDEPAIASASSSEAKLEFGALERVLRALWTDDTGDAIETLRSTAWIRGEDATAAKDLIERIRFDACDGMAAAYERFGLDWMGRRLGASEEDARTLCATLGWACENGVVQPKVEATIGARRVDPEEALRTCAEMVARLDA
jgi:hypothetical protein